MILRWGQKAPKASWGRVLDAGCGVGMYVKALLPYADEVYGAEIEDEYLELAAHNAPAAQLQAAAAEHLPYADNQFDLVLSHEVLEHVDDDRPHPLDEIGTADDMAGDPVFHSHVVGKTRLAGTFRQLPQCDLYCLG